MCVKESAQIFSISGPNPERMPSNSLPGWAKSYAAAHPVWDLYRPRARFPIYSVFALAVQILKYGSFLFLPSFLPVGGSVCLRRQQARGPSIFVANKQPPRFQEQKQFNIYCKILFLTFDDDQQTLRKMSNIINGKSVSFLRAANYDIYGQDLIRKEGHESDVVCVFGRLALNLSWGGR